MSSLTQRVRRLGKALVTALALGALVASAASAEVGPVPPEDLAPVKCDGFTEEQLEGVAAVFCVELQLLEGKTKFGSLESDIAEPITMRQVVGLMPDLSIVSIPEEGAGGGSSLPSVGVPGGLLGALGLYQGILQPIIDLLEPLNGVSGEIQNVGEMELSDPDLIAFLTGNGTLTTATMPIKVNIKNPLLGDSCSIGTDESPVEFVLPVELSGGYQVAGGGAPVPGQTQYARLDATDDSFAIPGAKDCGVLVGPLLNDVGLNDLNVFDTTINNSVGLPSASGNNLLDFDGYLGLLACGTLLPEDDPGSCFFQG